MLHRLKLRLDGDGLNDRMHQSKLASKIELTEGWDAQCKDLVESMFYQVIGQAFDMRISEARSALLDFCYDLQHKLVGTFGVDMQRLVLDCTKETKKFCREAEDLVTAVAGVTILEIRSAQGWSQVFEFPEIKF